MKNITFAELIELYQLKPHREGGFYRETYRARGVIPKKALPDRFGGQRCYSSAIYFLLPQGSKSRLHRIHSDEMWHFYLGDPLTIVQIHLNGKVEQVTLGHDVKSGHTVQHVVPAGHWFGAYPNTGGRFSFVGCTVAPGFDFADFEMGKRRDLLKQFPKAKDVIEYLTD
ncbi:MAG TPA: cupin domain-containing protein [Acidobacteriota bacterium]|jgi:hypothetical protein|nr:cupin domain-containing protein [Acidobacteriota bacterium]